MNSHARLFALSSLSLLLASCNTGGFTQPQGFECPAGFVANTVAGLNPKSKVSLKATDNKLNAAAKTNGYMVPGTYRYSSSSIYYIETKTGVRNPLQIGQAEILMPDGTAHQTGSGSCARNAYVGMSGIDVQAFVPTEVLVSADFSQVVTVGEVNFSIDNGVIKYASTKLDPATQPKLDETFKVPDPKDPQAKLDKDPDPTDPAVSNPVLIMNSASDFEYRAKVKVDGEYSYYISVHLTYIPPVLTNSTGSPDVRQERNDAAKAAAKAKALLPHDPPLPPYHH